MLNKINLKCILNSNIYFLEVFFLNNITSKKFLRIILVIQKMATISACLMSTYYLRTHAQLKKTVYIFFSFILSPRKKLVPGSWALLSIFSTLRWTHRYIFFHWLSYHHTIFSSCNMAIYTCSIYFRGRRPLTRILSSINNHDHHQFLLIIGNFLQDKI